MYKISISCSRRRCCSNRSNCAAIEEIIRGAQFLSTLKFFFLNFILFTKITFMMPRKCFVARIYNCESAYNFIRVKLINVLIFFYKRHFCILFIYSLI